MADTVDQHRAGAPQQVGCAVLTVSDTRILQDDRGGQLLVELLESEGHRIADRHITPDEPAQIHMLVVQLAQREDVDAILLTGGTGLSQRDQTYETVTALLTKSLTRYGELFRQLSYAQIGPAAMLSRAVGGLCGSTVVLTMPGSPAAVELAMREIILPELGHLVREARK
jgi:molybdenum cofactor biosynthesis protein B